jgi:hypothetical protein
MKLAELFARDPDFEPFRLLTPYDNDKIVRFFNQTSMQTTDLQLKYERHPNFFTFLKFQADQSFVMGADKDENDIKAVASFTIKDGYVAGKKSRVAYFGDLRVKGGITFSRKWQKIYGRILEHASSMEDAPFDYAITAVMGGNKKAIAALVDNPKTPYYYHKLCDYYMVNMVMPYKKIISLKNKNIFRAKENDRKELLNFLENQYQKRPFGFARDYLERAIDTWPDFSIRNFIIVKDKGQIVGATATWNPSPAKKIIIESLPTSLKFLNTMIKPFTKTAKVGEELKVQYLNFLNLIDGENLTKQDVLLSMVEFLRKENAFKEFDLVAFGDFEPFNYRHYLKGIITDETPLELYQVLHQTEREKQLSEFSAPPAFEISLV